MNGERESGAGTVVMTGIALTLLVLLSALVLLTQATIGASRAATAADLAALAAADAARGLTNGNPCMVAQEVVQKHQATLVSCRQTGPEGHVVEVSTSVHLSVLLGDATGRARAGPPPGPGPGTRAG